MIDVLSKSFPDVGLLKIIAKWGLQSPHFSSLQACGTYKYEIENYSGIHLEGCVSFYDNFKLENGTPSIFTTNVE